MAYSAGYVPKRALFSLTR